MYPETAGDKTHTQVSDWLARLTPAEELGEGGDPSPESCFEPSAGHVCPQTPSTAARFPRCDTGTAHDSQGSGHPEGRMGCGGGRRAPPRVRAPLPLGSRGVPWASPPGSQRTEAEVGLGLPLEQAKDDGLVVAPPSRPNRRP